MQDWQVSPLGRVLPSFCRYGDILYPIGEIAERGETKFVENIYENTQFNRDYSK
jgi:hypothetical protein